MSMETLDTYSVLPILSYLQYNDVLNFSTVFRGHFQAVDTHWQSLRVLDVDEFLDNQISTIDLSLIKNLRTLQLTRKRYLEKFENLFTAISTHCHQIEVLNIPAIPLINEDVVALSSLTTLKSLSITCRDVDDNVLGQLFQSNPGLQEVIIRDFNDTPVNGMCFEKLRNSLKSLTLIAFRKLNLNILLRCMENWQLELLYLDTQLKPDQMRILSRYTSFKSVRIELTDDSILPILLQNNPQLVELHVEFENGECSHFFRYLPLKLKKLSVKGNFSFSTNILLERLKILDLDSLEIGDNVNLFHQQDSSPLEYNLVRNLVELLPNLRTLTLPVFQSMSFQSLRELTKLTTLRLHVPAIEIDNVLKVISENCLNLEDIHLFEPNSLSKQGVEHLVKLPKLKKFSISDAGDLFNADCLTILSGCKTLETVRLIRCTVIEQNFSLPLLVNDTLKFIEFVNGEIEYSNDDFTTMVERIVDKINQQADRKQILTVTFLLYFQQLGYKGILRMPRLPRLLQLRDFIDNDSYLNETYSSDDIF